MTNKTTIAVDWITVTLPYPPELINVKTYIAMMLQSLGDNGELEQAKPYPHNYRMAYQGKYIKVSFDPDNPNMKLCLNITGRNLNDMYQAGYDIRWLIEILKNKNANFTRLDIAIDYYDYADVRQVYNAITSNPDTTLAKTLTPYHQMNLEDNEDVMTGIYIGSRKSDRFICLYDKAIQQEKHGEQWKRIELRNKGSKAVAMALGIVHSGIAAAGTTAIRTYANPPVAWWELATSGPIVDIPKVSRKDTDTIKWIKTTVMPVIERELDNPEHAPELFTLLKGMLERANDKNGLGEV